MGRKRADFPLKKQPGSNNWYVAYYTPDGIRKYKSTGVSEKDEAILKVAQWRSLGTIATGVRPSGLSESTIRAQAKFDDVTRDFFGDDCPYRKLRLVSNAKRADSTVSLQLSLLNNWIRPFFGELRISTLKSKDFEDFISYLKDNANSPAQIHNILVATKVILATLFKIERVPVDKSRLVPTYSRTPQKRKDFLELTEFQDLLFEGYREALHHEDSIPLWTMFAVCFLCGMRVGEIQALRWKNLIFQVDEDKNASKACFLVDADWQEESGTVKDSTKTYGSRYVPVPDIILNALNHKIAMKFLHKTAGDNTGSQFIFASIRNPAKPFYRATLNKYIKRECLRLNIGKNVSPHRGRDWFQSQLTGKVEKSLISYAIGHSQGSVDDTYQAAVFSQLEPIRAVINQLIDKEVKTVEVPAFR